MANTLSSKLLIISLCLFGGCSGVSAQQQAPGEEAAKPGIVVETGGPEDARRQQKKHYVVLVSLDGFRYDYPAKWGAPHIAEIARTGATAPDGMLPSYPSITFPNHVTLVTGLYPEHHGIVGNLFYDPQRKQSYSYKDPKTAYDGSWYKGTPLWSLAEQQGMRSASFFWPGSQAQIAGKRPNEYVTFLDTFNDDERIEQILRWLNLPSATRPHFITLYYSNTDHAGHEYGPDSPQVGEQVHHVDELMGKLKQKLDATGLPIDLVIVADHGMTTVQGSWIVLDQFANLDHFKTEGILLYPQSEADAEAAYQEFRAHPDPRFTAYRRVDVPAYLHFTDSDRVGDPVIVPNGPYIFRVHATTSKPPVGDHGYDVTRMPEMKALFVANGPDIKPGTEIKSFENVDVYDFIAKLLGLKTPANDGSLAPLKAALKSK